MPGDHGGVELEMSAIMKWLDRGLVSPSDMNSFLPDNGCPLRWKWRKERRAGIAVDKLGMHLGSNIHKMIKIYFQRIGDKPTEAEVKNVAESVYQDVFNRRDLGSVKKKAERCWENFVSFELNRLKSWDVYKPSLVEEKLYNEKHVGIIDFHSDPQSTTIDWKSGNLNQLGDTELRQGKVYENLLVSNEHQTETILFVALYTGRELEMPMVTAGWIDGERDKMLGMVRQHQFPKSVGPLCGWCPYVLDCEFSGLCLWL